MRLFKVLVMIGLAVGVFLAPAAALASFGIMPGKVYIENLYPGAEADVPITIYNQSDYEATFAVTAREPNYTDPEYEVFPHLDWITVTPNQITIGAGEESDVLVVIIMPEDADYSGKKAEVWISVVEVGASGMVQIELAARFFIATRVEEPAEAEPEPEVEGEGGVGITAEAGEPETVSPEEEPVTPEAAPSFNWAILGPVVGVVLLGVFVFLLIKRRHA